MDVQLLVYDLSRGMARQMSMGLLGFQLDAVYHTSIELQGREYVYDGGIIAIRPGSSHLGQPLQKLHLGITNLPMDVIEEYLDSVRPIFTVESYDLFRHNCNNFTDSFANFLLGKGIPSHIRDMPQAVMNSPLGQMLLPQLTQGVNANRQNGSILGLQQSSQTAPPPSTAASKKHDVKNITRLKELSGLLEQARQSCAVIFFTSATCGPCKVLYPMYDQLAEEHGGRATFIKVDIALPQAAEIANSFSVRATPTLVTFLKGEEENRWSGADPAKLRGNVHLLVQMANPSHPHEMLRLPSFSNPNGKPVLYTKVPPLPKLMAKMGENVASKPEVKSLQQYLEAREKTGTHDAVLPDMGKLAEFLQESISNLPVEVLFTIVDLVRCAMVDPRVSGFFAEEKHSQTVRGILDFVNNQNECPYPLRLVTLQMSCNLFSSPLFPREILRASGLRRPLIQLVSSSFLDDNHNNIRVAASSLLYNLALQHRQSRAKDSHIGLPDEDQVELGASVVEAISQEEKSSDALQGMLSALGHLVYGVDLGGELADLLRALDAGGTILSKKKLFPSEKLIAEVGTELLGKGLKRP
ncbi:hypothetical protein S40288_00466 [Stachybotrys chartarum IBT 40288]|nr:hypothetical protein S40288_00466 [Stachybotrys chartarum IBT 40288]